ncbi:MAG: DUF2079 domain-containing protein [Anaerolineae bacterium]
MSVQPSAEKRTWWRYARLTLGLVLILGILAVWLARASLPWSSEGLLPWQEERIGQYLQLTGFWFLFLGLIGTVSAILPIDHLLPRRTRKTSTRAILIPIVLALAFSVAVGTMGVIRHLRFNSTAYDLAIFEQSIWSTLHGRPFATSFEVSNKLADHFSPFLVVPVLPYALYQSPLTLVVLQALALGLGAIPVFRIAQRRLSSDVMATALAMAYLLYPALGFMARFDFHIEVFAVPALLAAFDAMEQERWRTATIWLAVPLLCKENLGLTAAAFGLYALLVRKKPSWGVAWVVVGLAQFTLTSFWLIPTLRGESSDTLMRYAWLGNSPVEMFKTVVTSPGQVWAHVTGGGRLFYLVQLLAPVGFLGLLGPLELALAAPGLAVNLLAQEATQSSIYLQYTVPIVPFVFVSAVWGMGRLRTLLHRPWAWYLAGLALIPLSLSAFLIENPFREQPFLPKLWSEIENADTVRQALETIPKEGTMVTTNNYAPHMAQRPEIYIIGFPSQRDAPSNPDVVFLNLRDQRWLSCENYRAYLLQLDPERYGMTFESDGVVVIQRDAGSCDRFRALIDAWPGCSG